MQDGAQARPRFSSFPYPAYIVVKILAVAAQLPIVLIFPVFFELTVGHCFPEFGLQEEFQRERAIV